MSYSFTQSDITGVLSYFTDAIQQPNSILIALGPEVTFDQIAAAAGLQAVFKDTGIDVRVASAEPFDDSIGISFRESVVQDIGNENLVVSFDYDEEKVDKVSYHIGEETKKFYLTIKPKKGVPPLDTSSLAFDYIGAHADVVICFGVRSFDQLGQLYIGYEEMFEHAFVVAFSEYFWDGPTHCVEIKGSGEYSAVCAHIVQKLQLHMPQDGATAFLAGITVSTNDLKNPDMAPEMFEMIAFLLKQGAQRLPAEQFRVPSNKNSRKKMRVERVVEAE